MIHSGLHSDVVNIYKGTIRTLFTLGNPWQMQIKLSYKVKVSKF